MGLTVYRLVQKRWCGGTLTDFDLPMDLGLYETADAARLTRDARILVQAVGGSLTDGWTDENDYQIDAVHVSSGVPTVRRPMRRV